jgi:hypothetical protein
MGRPTIIKIGAKVGLLEVIGIKASFGSGTNALAVCRCACGTVKDIRSVALRKMRSCGCSQHDASVRKPREPDTYPCKPSGEAAMNTFYASYLSKAKRHGDEFTFSKEEFVALVSKPCSYCGAPPAKRMAYRKDGSPMYNGAAYASGIDRLDNSKGYTYENSVPCCTECNLSKHTRSRSDFEDHSFRVVLHYLKQRLDPSTQKEHRRIAEDILKVLTEIAPVTMSAFFNDRLNADSDS